MNSNVGLIGWMAIPLTEQTRTPTFGKSPIFATLKCLNVLFINHRFYPGRSCRTSSVAGLCRGRLSSSTNQSTSRISLQGCRLDTLWTREDLNSFCNFHLQIHSTRQELLGGLLSVSDLKISSGFKCPSLTNRPRAPLESLHHLTPPTMSPNHSNVLVRAFVQYLLALALNNAAGDRFRLFQL